LYWRHAHLQGKIRPAFIERLPLVTLVGQLGIKRCNTRADGRQLAFESLGGNFHERRLFLELRAIVLEFDVLRGEVFGL
jgi:hypothetical protein